LSTRPLDWQRIENQRIENIQVHGMELDQRKGQGFATWLDFFLEILDFLLNNSSA
jgi:hypothetical protein